MNYPITVTLNAIRKHHPCASGWTKLLTHLGKTRADDAPFPLTTVLLSNNLGDAIWCCRCLPEYDREWRLFAVWCARQVQHLTTDPRSIAALDVAERFANGQATADELATARDAAWDAAWETAGAAGAALAAAGKAAGDAIWGAARDAAWAAAGKAAGDAAWVAAREAAWDAQRAAFLQLITTGELP
jgi:hypothetical protein